MLRGKRRRAFVFIRAFSSQSVGSPNVASEKALLLKNHFYSSTHTYMKSLSLIFGMHIAFNETYPAL